MTNAGLSKAPSTQKEIYNTLWAGFDRYEHMFDYATVEKLAQTLESYFVNGNLPPKFEDIKNAIQADTDMKQMLEIEPNILRKVITATMAAHGHFDIETRTISADEGKVPLSEDVAGIEVVDRIVQIGETIRAGLNAVVDLREPANGSAERQILEEVQRTIMAVVEGGQNTATVNLFKEKSTGRQGN